MTVITFISGRLTAAHIILVNSVNRRRRRIEDMGLGSDFHSAALTELQNTPV